MSYSKIGFVNDETEASAENFDYMEEGIKNAYNVPLLAVSEEAPSECSEGDKYYNIEDNLIYTATGTDTWGENGEEPLQDILYVVFSEKNTYAYDGTEMLSVGGGSGSEVVVGTEEPTEDTKLVIDEYDLEPQYTEAEYYSTEEVETNKIWINGKKIYRKVLKQTNFTLSTSGSSVGTIANINTLCNCFISLEPIDHTYIRSGYLNSNYYEGIQIQKSNGDVTVWGKDGSNQVDIIIVLEYTKSS